MLVVRWIHLLGMAVVLGGAVLSWAFLRRSGVSGAAALSFAAGYERARRGPEGALVATGVGNLGRLAPHVPTLDTEWGAVFAAKLLAVAAVLVVSLVRTLAVRRARRADASSAEGVRVLRVGYALTAAWLAGIVALAGVLAHG